MNTSEKQKEVKKFINKEKLHLCAVIETHIKYAKIKKVADFVYGNWDYVINGENNNKGCRIMVGWDPNMIQVWMLGKEKQCVHRQVVNGIPWVILGDFNKCVADLEIEDILSSGFQFTWTKSLKNPECKTLKKLDRVMVSEEFMDKYPNSHGIFLPYIISDHSPAILLIPNGGSKKKRAFRFSNFITEKEEFYPTVMTE
ncbi:RNA-directed DNA polymerase, eukaryota, reverse transcriptase zinc-binding domain protein [Tanacetum coccineum]